MDKKDLYIKAKLQEDKKISSQANEIFKKFEGGINLENNNKPKERNVIKLSLNQAILAFTSFVIVVILGGNLYAHLNGKPNIYSAIKNLFIKEAKYTESEILVDQTVESNGIKLTLKTVAMDENVLITKYVAEGEKLANEFYTYPEFEEDMIQYAKLVYAAMGYDIGEDGYKNISADHIEAKLTEISQKLKNKELTEEETKRLLDLAKNAYCGFIGAELGDEFCSSEKAKELIADTIAMFESKVASKYQIMQSNDTLQDFGVKAISQKIDRSGNQFIIYNVYNVDTISDLASKFNLSVKVTQIGSTKGTWNFNTELEKARLDTRVETINFYEKNSYDNVAPNITLSDNVRHTATVEAKKLIISDFSTVLMIQTAVDEEDREHYLDGYAHNGLPCVFVVTDEEGNVLGAGSASESTFESALNAGDVIKYTDRIILENVDKDTKKLYVKIYEQWDMSEYGYEELEKVNIHTMVLDIEEARNSSKPVELTQSYASKEVQVSFKYPGDWKVEESDDKITVISPENIDGEVAEMTISKKEDEKTAKEIVEQKTSDLDSISWEYTSGTQKIAGIEGYYYTADVEDDIATRVLVNNENDLYDITFVGIETQYARYEETFDKILETIEFIEPEKSYVAYYMDNSNDSWETVKVYEDNTATVQISEYAREIWDKELTPKIEANKEYQITGINGKIIGMDFLNSVEGGAYVGSCLFIYVEEGNLYLVDMHEGIATGKFEAKEIDEIELAIHREKPHLEDLAFGDRQLVVIIINDINGVPYVISRDGTVEKYVHEQTSEEDNEEHETTSSNQQTQNNEGYTVIFDNDICTVKQYEKYKRITVEWKDTDYDYQEIKYGSIKTNNEYTITGMQGPVKEVFIIHKDRQDENLPGILFWCENNKVYYVRWDIVHSDSTINILWEHDNVTEISQTSGTWLDAKKDGSACTITYMGLTHNQD